MPKIRAATLEQHRVETIALLLDAWGKLVMERGYAEVSLADVAAEVGLARTAIYGYFPDREALLFAWTEREVQRTLEILEREVAEATTSAAKLSVFVGHQLLEFTNRHLPPGHEVIQFLQPETYSRFMEHIEPLEKILRGIIEEGAKTGEFGRTDTDETLPLVMACIGAERVPLAMKTHDLNEATERVTSFLLRALGSKESQERSRRPKGAAGANVPGRRKRSS